MTKHSSICRPRDQRGDALAGNRSAQPSRRTFLRLLAAGVAAAPFLRPESALAGLRRVRTVHPEPRPGIDGSRVLTAEQLANAPDLIELYDGIREIPHIVDGIHCYCGCGDLEGFRSLLICYEEGGMPKHCDICRDQGRLAVARSKEGQTLDQIRRATDARFGPGGVAHGAARRRRLVLGLAAAALALPAITPAQGAAQVEADYRISQRAAVEQVLSTTTVKVEYHRPRARGRSPLFGGVVHWGEVWTPGANDATVLELSKDVKLDGHPVPAGRWSVWMIPSDVGPWELLLDPRDTLFHTQPPELAEEAQIRFTVRTEPVEHVEALTWSFPRVEQDNATLRMAWGTLAVPLEIEVESVMPTLTVSSDEAARYVGEWEMTFLMSPQGPTGPPPPPVPMQVRHADDGTLRYELPPGTFVPPADTSSADPASGLSGIAAEQARERAEARRAVQESSFAAYDLLLVPRADGVFLLGIAQDGVLLDIEHVFHEFEFDGGRAVHLTIRDDEDTILARGERAR